MAPRARSRSRSRSRQPSEGGKPTSSTPRSRRSSIKGGSAAKPKRKALPFAEHQNSQLMGGKVKPGPLKLQELTLDGGVKITICRVKLPTPKGVSGHLIRRLDTDAVSASSLFRVAFPTASEEDEEEEMAFLADQYDTLAAGHPDEAHRLWIPSTDVLSVASEYNMTQFVSELLAYELGSETPAKAVHSITTPSSAQTPDLGSTPLRSSKRQRTKSHDSSAIKPSVTVSQTIASDPMTGEIAETTQVTVEGEGLIGSDATVAKAVADAKHLVDTLRAEGTLPSVEGEVNVKKRSAADIADALVPSAPSSGILGRVFGARDGRRVVTPGGRRLIALGGVLVTGAAAAAAPYFFG